MKGESHLLTGLAQDLVVTRERRMHFTKCSLLMQDLLAAKRDLRLSREIKRLGRYEGLIIDDLGYIQQTRDDMEVVFTLLAEHYERGSVLMTSNLQFSKWEGIRRLFLRRHSILPAWKLYDCSDVSLNKSAEVRMGGERVIEGHAGRRRRAHPLNSWQPRMVLQ